MTRENKRTGTSSSALLGWIWRLSGPVIWTVWIMAAATAEPATQDVEMGNIFGSNLEMESLYWDIERNDKGEMVKSIMKGEVVIRGEKLDLDCDLLTLDMAKDRLVALGRPVKIRQVNLAASCENFEHFPKEGKSILTGHPMIRNVAEDGTITETRATRITTFQNEDGSLRIIVEGKGNGRVKVKVQDNNSAPRVPTPPNLNQKPAITVWEPRPPKGAPQHGPKKAERIDKSNFDKIPEPSLGEEE